MTDALPDVRTNSTPPSREALEAGLRETGYIPDPQLTLTVWLAIQLGKPLLVEGPAGVGKTELARSAAFALGRELVRLQCYEGLDEGKALYEWDYGKQMLYTQLVRESLARATSGADTIQAAIDRVAGDETGFYDRRFLLRRPLLQALESDRPVVLLLDEVDRADPEFEAFLLETLAELQVTIPELGTIRARHRPLVFLTTNGTREMTEALRRRCLHLFVDYPTPEREIAIIEARVPGIDPRLTERLVAFVERLRSLELRKSPSISETIDWARSLLILGAHALDRGVVEQTLGVLLKHHEDQGAVAAKLDSMLG
jgi:MoxR-like ATPase